MRSSPGKDKTSQPRLVDPDLLPKRRWKGARKSRAERSVPDKRNLWRVDIKHVLAFQYGYPLPNDDAGDECFALLCHAAYGGRSPDEIAPGIRGTAEFWADWKTDLSALIEEVTNRPRKLNKKIIGIELGLTKVVWEHPDVQAQSLWPIDYTNAEWKRDKAEKDRQRAARNRAAKRGLSKTAQCIDFLRKVLAVEPAPAARIMRLAIALGLEKPGAKRFGKPMKEACKALGVLKPKQGMNGGWRWGLPQAEKRPETPCFAEGDLAAEKTPCFPEGDFFRSPIKKVPSVRTVLDEGKPASKGAASDEQQRCGGVELLDEDEAIESEATLDLPCAGDGSGLVQMMNLDRLPSSSPALVPRRDGFGRVPIEQRWAQPMRMFARASRQDRERGWAVIMAQGDGLALQAARHRWGGVPVINQHGGEA